MTDPLTQHYTRLAKDLDALDDVGDNTSRQERSQLARDLFDAAKSAKQDGEEPALVEALNEGGWEAMEPNLDNDLHNVLTPTEVAEQLMDALRAAGRLPDED